MLERLRIGILCDGTTFPRWQARCLTEVMRTPGVDVVLVVQQQKAPPPVRSVWQRLRYYPWHIGLFLWWRRNRFRPQANIPEDLAQVLSGIPTITCAPQGPATAQRFSTTDLEHIAAHRPDVLLRFGFNILHGEILTLPRFGVWSYHHGDEEHYRGQPPGFWEIMDGSPVIGTILQRLNERLDGGHILRKGWFMVTPHSLSRTVSEAMLGSTSWMADVCKDLLLHGDVAAQGSPSTTKAAVRKYPGNIAFLRFIMDAREERGHQRSTTRANEEWNLGVFYQPISTFLAPRPNLNPRWLPAPGTAQSRCTPFGYFKDDRLNVLYAKHDRAAGTSEIARVRPKRDNILKRSRVMLSSATTISYPYTIETPVGLRVILEDREHGRVDLYRLDAEETALEFEQTLLNEALTCPSMIEHGGRWYLFGTKAPLEDAVLHIFHSPALAGPWLPHAHNPVKTDVRSARPAGSLFEHEGVLYRPAADMSRSDTRSIHLMRVIRLSPTAFEEVIERTLGPMKGSAWSHGVGTLTAVGAITLIDGFRRVQAAVPTKTDKHRRKRGARTSSVDDDDDQDD